MSSGHQVELVDTSERLEKIVSECSAYEMYAIDTEFHREKNYYPKLALVQIQYGQTIALIDPTVMPVSPLKQLFSSDCLAVMHACSQDLEVLLRYCNAVPKKIFDTQIAAGFLGQHTPSLSALHQKFLKKKLPKGERLTDWFHRPLSVEQMKYAASDVANLLELHSLLVKELTDRKRITWAQAEFDLVLNRAYETNNPRDAWTRIKEVRHLNSAGKGVAQAIAEWRESKAQSSDVPVRFILSDLCIVGIAQRMPDTLTELRKVRGVESKHLSKGRDQQLLALVVDGKQRKVKIPAQKKRRSLDPSLRPAATLLAAWLAQFAKDSDLDPALLSTRADIESLLRNDADSRLMHGWRAEHVGDPVSKLLQGEAALAFEDGRLVLEDRR